MAIQFGNNRGNNQTNSTQPAPASPVINTTAQVTPTQNASPSAFTRYIGYTDASDFEKKLIELYADTKTNGIFIDKPIQKPLPAEAGKYTSIPGVNAELTTSSVTNIFNFMHTSKILDFGKIGTGTDPTAFATVVCGVLDELKASGVPANIIKNTFLNSVCWLIRYSSTKLENILYVGDITKYEVYWLYILSKAGCRVTYVNYTSDNSYKAVDPASKYSTLIQGTVFSPLSINFGKINMAAYQQAAQANEKLNEIVNASTPMILKYLTTMHETMSKDLTTTLEERKMKTLCTDTTLPVYFTAYIGYDDETTYKNTLFTLKEDLTNKNKQLIFLEKLSKPSYGEAEEYYSIQKTNNDTMISNFASKISIKDNMGRTVLTQKAFINALRAVGGTNMYNTAVQLSVWIKKFTSNIDFYKNDLPVILYFGLVTPLELQFLNIMSQTGFDILYFSPDKSVLNVLNSSGLGNIQIIERADSQTGMAFPDRMIRTKMATNAYNAERSLDTVLYNDNTMFRDYQFKMSHSQTLKTTYEELGLMWHQEAKYRTGFDSRENYVIVPNMFAKINGVNKGDIQSYYKDISIKLSPLSVYYNKVPFFKPVMPNEYYTAFYEGTKVKIEELKRSKHNKYDYMNDDIQYLLFHKMQEVIDSGFIDVPEQDIVPLVINTVLNLPQPLLQLLQQFDFTKDIPKIVIVANGKQTFAVFECILLVLFNMIGFDIIIFTPTGYKNLETYIRPEAYESFNLGEFKYDFRPENLRIPKEIPQEKTSFFDRIFKGRK